MQNSESKQKVNVVPIYASLQWDFYHSSAVSSFVNQQNQQQQQQQRRKRPPYPQPHRVRKFPLIRKLYQMIIKIEMHKKVCICEKM